MRVSLTSSVASNNLRTAFAAFVESSHTGLLANTIAPVGTCPSIAIPFLTVFTMSAIK